MLLNITKALTRSTVRNLSITSRRFLTGDDNQTKPSEKMVDERFYKVEDPEILPEKDEEISLTTFDPVHQLNLKRMKQNFGPIPLSKSTKPKFSNTFDHMARDGELYGGIEYLKLPIATILARWNNTIIHVRDPEKKNPENLYVHLSSSQIGIKGGKKKTEFAGEETGREAAIKALERGCPTHVRVVIRGVGPGRKATTRGLGLGGFTVVSVSDQSPLYLHAELPQRPRKIRRI